ncbi:MAG: hypothetical protein G01um101438_461 [Parcubacteria group bacterium Gr01-1014_38]|nr:MAG: hypothetical protein G01um101438_461 [Parcubacteria group bacterium Gr01-1014_38]
MDENEAEYRTDSLGLAAVLVTAGFPLVRIEGDLPRHGEFVFRREASLEEMVSAYRNGTLKLPAFHLVVQLKAIKDRLYEEARIRQP